MGVTQDFREEQVSREVGEPLKKPPNCSPKVGLRIQF
jgi:hypothetical protein